MFLEWESNSGKLQIISGKFQNNAINDVKQISLSHVINTWNHATESTMPFFPYYHRCADKSLTEVAGII